MTHLYLLYDYDILSIRKSKYIIQKIHNTANMCHYGGNMNRSSMDFPFLCSDTPIVTVNLIFLSSNSNSDVSTKSFIYKKHLIDI